MGLSRQRMLERMQASDARYDGRFIVGVLTTGIYCLPSCRARKPKAENVRFYRRPEDALAAGLRPCKRCQPELFYRRVDPDLERLEAVVGELRLAPSGFAGVDELAGRCGVGRSKLNELVRRHYHRTPAELLARSRVEHAATALHAEPLKPVVEIALEAGFGSLSVFNQRFRAQLGMPPSRYRELHDLPDAWHLDLPSWFERRYLLRYLGRDPAGLSERCAGSNLRFATRLVGRPAAVEVELGPRSARCRVEAPRPLPPGAGADAHAQVLRVLGLTIDPRPFERRLQAENGLRRLTSGRSGLTIPQTRQPFDGLLWVIAGQQISLAAAIAVRRRLIERLGDPVDGDLVAPPTAEAIARLDAAELRSLGLSRPKADYLLGISRTVAAGDLDLDRLASRPATVIEARLSGLRGLGPWSVHYLMMRSFGLADCVPVGDAGLHRALERFFGLQGRPDRREVPRLLAPFAPYRSLATFHFWATLEEAP